MSDAKVFQEVPIKKHPRSVFPLDHTVATTGNMGNLIPVCLLEAVPGGKYRISNETMLRLVPMVFPMMHPVTVSCHYYFVPNRILWPGWEDFITDNRDANGNLPAFPTIDVSLTTYTKLLDYLFVPNPNHVDDDGYYAQAETISAIPCAAYQAIWYEHFRDQNMIDIEPNYELKDGDNAIQGSYAHLTTMRRRAWEHDYFTSCLPLPQKGPAVQLPVTYIQDLPVYRDAASIIAPGTLTGSTTVTPTDLMNFPATDPGGIINANSLYADASQLATNASTLADLREAWALQAWYEANARGGTRYPEQLMVHFNVRPEDARLQRPEYITGTYDLISVSEVLNTTGTDNAPQGAMAGHGISYVDGQSKTFYAKEHGYIIGVLSVRPKTSYHQGIDKHYKKIVDQFDYLFPEFQFLGEQPVLQRELYAYTASGEDTFGYMPNYTEYRFMSNKVTGKMRRGQLASWHMGRDFIEPPTLNQQFIECDPTHRVFAVTDPDEDKLIILHNNKITATLPLSQYGQPSTL